MARLDLRRLGCRWCRIATTVAKIFAVPARASPSGATLLSAHGIKVLAANLDIAGLAPAVVVGVLGAITILLTVMPPIPFARTGTPKQS